MRSEIELCGCGIETGAPGDAPEPGEGVSGGCTASNGGWGRRWAASAAWVVQQSEPPPKPVIAYRCVSLSSLLALSLVLRVVCTSANELQGCNVGSDGCADRKQNLVDLRGKGEADDDEALMMTVSQN